MKRKNQALVAQAIALAFMFSISAKARAQWLFGPAPSVLSLRSAGGSIEFKNDASVSETLSLASAMREENSDFEADQLEFCAHTSQKGCPVFDTPLAASGFLLAPNHLLVTSFHLLHAELSRDYSRMIRRNDPHSLLRALSRLPIYLTALKPGGERAFSTVQNPGQVRVQSMNPSIYFLGQTDTKNLFEQNLFGELSDLVLLQTQVPHRSIGEFYPAEQPARPGDRVRILGYPVSRKGDVPLNPQETSGRVLTPEKFLSLMHIHETKAMTELRHKFMLYIAAPCPEGFSGGPIVNEKGQVVGVVGGYYRTQKARSYICYGVNLQSLPRLIAYWEFVNNQTLRHVKTK